MLETDVGGERRLDVRLCTAAHIPVPQVNAQTHPATLTGAQLRQLRSRWLATTVSLINFAGYEKCSRAIVVNRLVDLHELVTIVCAAVGFDDDEHLYHLEIADGFYSAQQYVWVERAELAGNHTLAGLELTRGDRWHLHYDMGDDWHFLGRLLTLPAEIAPALRAFERAPPDPARRPLPHPRPSSQAVPARRQGRRLVTTAACPGLRPPAGGGVAKLVTRAGGAGGRSRAA